MNYRVIKENDLFLITDEKGDIYDGHQNGLGLYTQDTRFLSKLALKINGKEPILLSSEANQNFISTIILTNPHMEENNQLILWRESVEITRTRFIYNGVFYEMVKAKNYYPKTIEFALNFSFDSDFKDMFLIRGFRNGKIGERKETIITNQKIMLRYEGADGIKRATIVAWDNEASQVKADGEIEFKLSLKHDEEQVITFTVSSEINGKTAEPIPPLAAIDRLKDSYEKMGNRITSVKTDNLKFQQMIDRGIHDLHVLLTDIGYGQLPVAGLPWFAVPFGRDSLIAALQMLAFNPEIAKGTLLTMAAYQGTKQDTWRDEQPGKIMHEIRFGELANTNQVPFTPYYGSIDATPLFLILMVEYLKWTGDIALFKKLEQNIDSALKWIDNYGDRDGDLFVEYYQEAERGFANQGWKDSGDSIVHRNGEYGEPPIALAEVQGYVYQAKIGLAAIYEHIGKIEAANQLRQEAHDLREKFNKDFWMDEHTFYAMALDKGKSQVGTLTSNPGHLILAEIIDKDRAEKISKILISPKMFSGYGVRTMGDGEAGYNPMSYHDGSVWPHDNSLIVLGMSKMGLANFANKIIEGQIKAADYFEYARLPELFCGYSDSLGHVVKYPVACSPQAWAAGTPLAFVQAILGLFPDSLAKTIYLKPSLPEGINELKVNRISIGSGELAITITKNQEGLNVIIEKNTTGFNIVQN